MWIMSDSRVLILYVMIVSCRVMLMYPVNFRSQNISVVKFSLRSMMAKDGIGRYT